MTFKVNQNRKPVFLTKNFNRMNKYLAKLIVNKNY